MANTKKTTEKDTETKAVKKTAKATEEKAEKVNSFIQYGSPQIMWSIVYLTLDPEKTRAIMDSVGTETQKLESLGKSPIIVTSPIVRMYFKKLTEDYFKDLIVVSQLKTSTILKKEISLKLQS